MKLSLDNQGTSKPPQGRGRGTDGQTGQPSPLFERNRKRMFMCTVPAFGEHSYGQEEPTTNSVFTGRIYREPAGLDHLYFQNVI